MDDKLREIATATQWEVYCAVQQHGSQKAAAASLGKAVSTVSETMTRLKNKAALRGLAPEHDMTRTVPDGYHVKGVSTYYGPDGEMKGQWVKSNVDRERQEALFWEALKGFKDEMPRVEASPVVPEDPSEDLLICYPVGDHHMGMLAWGPETGGQDWDISIAEKTLHGATDYLVSAAPSTHEALLLLTGDFLHYDSFTAATPQSGHILDADGRFPKMVQATIRAIRHQIATLLTKHYKVRVIVEIGNHDPASTIWLQNMLAAFYEDEDRVTVDCSPMNAHIYVFGDVMIGSHHGDKIRDMKLVLMFATQWAEEWGRTKHRYIHTGHLHHFAEKDLGGATIITTPVLAPNDAYSAGLGYRSTRAMRSIYYHREHGEAGGTRFIPGMI